MNDDYLWDGRGEPVPELQRLEESLKRFRETPAPLLIPEEEFAKLRHRGWFFGMRWTPPRIAFAALALVAIAGTTGLWLRRTAPRAEASWAVARLNGSPRIGAAVLNDQAQLAIGQWLETDASSRARIAVSNIGEVVVGPNSRLRITEAHPKHKQLTLARGELTARITAPPWLFYVETASATAVDLGCEYTLKSDENGNGLLRVTLGWVQLFDGVRQAIIPAGAAAKLRHGFGPGTAYFEDTSPEFQQALELLDFGAKEPDARARALSLVLSEARKKDALSLFPLLVHVAPEERGPVYDRLARLIPPPPGVTRDGILRHDEKQINLWWDKWGIGHPKK